MKKKKKIGRDSTRRTKRHRDFFRTVSNLPPFSRRERAGVRHRGRGHRGPRWVTGQEDARGGHGAAGRGRELSVDAHARAPRARQRGGLARQGREPDVGSAQGGGRGRGRHPRVRHVGASPGGRVRPASLIIGAPQPRTLSTPLPRTGLPADPGGLRLLTRTGPTTPPAQGRAGRGGNARFAPARGTRCALTEQAVEDAGAGGTRHHEPPGPAGSPGGLLCRLASRPPLSRALGTKPFLGTAPPCLCTSTR